MPKYKRHGNVQRKFVQSSRKHQANSEQNDNRSYPQQREPRVKLSLREDQVGITEFITDNIGFTGVLKSRFSDFHVNEIGMDGKILQLTDITIPQPPVELSATEDELSAVKNDLKDFVTEEIWEKIAILAAANPKSKDAASIDIEIGNLDKEKRTQIHKFFKSSYGGRLCSTTIVVSPASVDVVKETEPNEKRCIRIQKASKKLERSVWNFPGEYVYFLVHKENMDTSEVSTAIANRLSMHPSQVNYAGTKDKRAKTTQLFCVKKRTPSDIVGAVKSMPYVRVGNFIFGNNVVKLGDLKGNRFRIALRHVTGDQQQIAQSLEKLREKGFINYFGLQRFGNCASIPTYEIGVALLKADYKLACELILKPRDGDLPFLHSVRETWWKNRDSAAAAAMLYNNKFIEKKLLLGLAEYGESDYATALRKIPRNMLVLYPHAFQSLIFNRIASKRIKEFGSKLIVGDLVFKSSQELDVDELLAELDRMEAEANIEVQCTEEAENKIETPSKFKTKVKSLTAEDIESGKYTLCDVLLPLPGHDITYPDNVVGQWYEDMLKEFGLSSEKFRHNVKTFAMTGTYRKLIIKPAHMSWEFCQYGSAESTLIASDWDLLKGIEPDKKTEGKMRALLLDFSLPTSAYATMMLRELLRIDTSPANQMALEKQAAQEFKNHENDEAIQSQSAVVGAAETCSDSPLLKSECKRDAVELDDGDGVPDIKKSKS